MIVGRDLVLDIARLANVGGDPLDTVLLLAIINANVAAVSSRPDLQRIYGSEANLIPDEIRRPIPVSALARSLAVPFETARRRISHFRETGLVVMASDGVIVPTEVLQSQPFTDGARASLLALRDAYRRVAALGLTTPQPGAQPAVSAADGLRLAARLTTDYFLRMVDALNRRVGSLIDALILLQANRENTAALPDWRGPGAAYAADADKQPATTATIARALLMSAETVRRRLKRLEGQGLCQSVPGGFILSETLIATQFDDLRAFNEVNLMRLIRRVEEFGLAQGWAERLAAPRAP